MDTKEVSEAKNTARKMKVVGLELVKALALFIYGGICGTGIWFNVIPELLGETAVQISVSDALTLLVLVALSFWIMYVTGGMIDELHVEIKKGETDA